MGSFIGPYIKELRSRLAALDIFDHDGSYARACRYQKEASALGAALYQMEGIYFFYLAGDKEATLSMSQCDEKSS